MLIDVSDLFTGDFTGVSRFFAEYEEESEEGDAEEGTKGASFTLDPDMTFIRSVKSFPENAVVETQFHFKRSLSAAMKQQEAEENANQRVTLADPRSLPVRVVYNLWPQPAPGYHPRLADSRVGYFIVGQINDEPAGFQNFADDRKPNPYVYYLNRWRLEKSDPAVRALAARQAHCLLDRQNGACALSPGGARWHSLPGTPPSRVSGCRMSSW